MGHITLGIADIEFVQPDEIVLDEDDLIILGDRGAPHRAGHASPRAQVEPARPTVQRRPAPRRVGFDDMKTAVRAVPRLVRAR